MGGNEGRKLFARAEQEEKALEYHEPPNYIRPVAETEAAALLAVGDWTGAKRLTNVALVERPQSGFALYGIARSDENLGHAGLAAKAYAAFLAAWKYADTGLAELTHAQNFIAEHPLHAAILGLGGRTQSTHCRRESCGKSCAYGTEPKNREMSVRLNPLALVVHPISVGNDR